MHPSMPRWIEASVTDYFKTALEAAGWDVFIEGMDRNTDDKAKYLELRIDGPYHREPSHNYKYYYIEVNILVSTKKVKTDFHEQFRGVGIAAEKFIDEIIVKKYGNDPGDDLTVTVGCLQLRTEGIQISHFGQVDPDIGLYQSSVEGHYDMDCDL